MVNERGKERSGNNRTLSNHNKEMKVLNLYAGIGGNRKDWDNCEVTAVESNPKIAAIYKELYPGDTVVVGDAHQYLLDRYSEFDVVWTSTPCQSHTRLMKFTRHKVAKYPDMKLYQEIIFLDNFFKGVYVVENVVPYYTPLIPPTHKIGRHLFWSNIPLPHVDIEQPKGFTKLSNMAGKKVMMDWLGIHFDKNVYYEGNHCPVQILRNAVHPKIGHEIFKAIEAYEQLKTTNNEKDIKISR